ARDAVEARRQVDDRGLSEPLVAVPARRLGEGEVDLHLRAAVAEGHLRSPEEALVELRRRDVRDDRARGADLVSVFEPDSGGGAVPDEHPLDIAPGLTEAAVIADQRDERVDEPRPAAARDRHPA